MESKDGEAMLRDQAEAFKLIYAFVDSMALKCAVDLQIPDIIESQGGKLTLSQIASSIASPSPNTDALNAVMRFLVRKKVFSITTTEADNGETETLYSLSPISRWFLHDNTKLNLTPVFSFLERDVFAPFFYVDELIKNGSTKDSAFEIALGFDIWDFAAQNPDFNKNFNDTMASFSRMMIGSIIKGYENGFCKLNSLVDVGGGTGKTIYEITKAYPHIKGVNFDLPHVIDTAPTYEGITHVGGNMFETVPSADAIFMKMILHDWSDEDCVKILRTCKNAIPQTTGKIIIADIVLQPEGNNLFDDVSFAFTFVMTTVCTGGKERTTHDWNKIFKEAGFSHYNIIKIPCMLSIIEAYP